MACCSTHSRLQKLELFRLSVLVVGTIVRGTLLLIVLGKWLTSTTTSATFPERCTWKAVSMLAAIVLPTCLNLLFWVRAVLHGERRIWRWRWCMWLPVLVWSRWTRLHISSAVAAITDPKDPSEWLTMLYIAVLCYVSYRIQTANPRMDNCGFWLAGNSRLTAMVAYLLLWAAHWPYLKVVDDGAPDVWCFVSTCLILVQDFVAFGLTEHFQLVPRGDQRRRCVVHNRPFRDYRAWFRLVRRRGRGA